MTRKAAKKSHQSHKSKEEKAKKHMDLEDATGYSGTFRWNKTQVFPPLPPAATGPLSKMVYLVFNWGPFFQLRDSGRDGVDGTGLAKLAEDTPAMVDALSFPLTIIMAINKLKIQPPEGGEVFNIVMIGASEKAEQRVVQDTNYMEEVAYAFPESKIRVWVVGPEVNAKVLPRQSQLSNLDFRFKRSTAGNFLLDNDELKKDPGWRKNTLVFGWNCGFGAGNFDLMQSWLQDLYIFSSSDIPCVFTCASDRDIMGEATLLIKIVGAKFLVYPQANPYRMATTFLPEASKKNRSSSPTQEDLSNGNMSWYAIKGYDKSLRIVIETRREDTHRQVYEALHRKDVSLEKVLRAQVQATAAAAKGEDEGKDITTAKITGSAGDDDDESKEDVPLLVDGMPSPPPPAAAAPSPSTETGSLLSKPSAATTRTENGSRTSSAATQSSCVEGFVIGTDGSNRLLATIHLPEMVRSKEDVLLDLSEHTIKCSMVESSSSSGCWTASLPHAVCPETARASFSVRTRVLKVAMIAQQQKDTVTSE